MKWTSPRGYWLLSMWVIAATAGGIFLVDYLSKPKDQDYLAPASNVRQCGQKPKLIEAEREFIKTWLVGVDKVTANGKIALIRTISALPEKVLATLKERNIRFSVDAGFGPYTCTADEKSSNRASISCLKSTPKDGEVLVLGYSQLIQPDGKPRVMTDDAVVDESLMPVTFWLMFEKLLKPDDGESFLEQSVVSKENVMDQVKRYVVGGYNFSPEEQDFYRREFGAGGVETPAFISRTLTLTANSLYCDGESYARLGKSQPEAVKRFMSSFGCALGKPWHMEEKEFVSLCPQRPEQAREGRQ